MSQHKCLRIHWPLQGANTAVFQDLAVHYIVGMMLYLLFSLLYPLSPLEKHQRSTLALRKPRQTSLGLGIQIDKMRSPTSSYGSPRTPSTPSFHSKSLFSPGSSPLSTPPSSPIISIQTPPSSPLQPEDYDLKDRISDDELPSIPLFHSAEHVFQEIEYRRHSFFAAIKELVTPLLGEDNNIKHFANLVRGKNANLVPVGPVRHPAGVQAILKPHQRHGLDFLVYLRQNGIGGILADDMGLGKTIQTLALFQHVKEQADLMSPEPAPFLVVCPLSVMKTWLTEIRKWTPGLTVIKFHGTAEEREKIKTLVRRERNSIKGISAAADIVITSYETLISDIVWFQRAFYWKYVVLDEGHRIKNGHSKRAQMLARVRAEFKTPIQNNLRELWSIFNWLYPDVFVPSTEDIFNDAFSLNEGRFDRSFLEDIKRFLNLVMIRRNKDSPALNLNIPPKSETIISVPLSTLQHSWYLRILTGAGALLDGEEKSSFMNSIHKLRQAEGLDECEEDTGNGVSVPPTSQLGHKTEKQKIRILDNILMELRKCSIHPYLLDDAIPEDYALGSHIVENSGKFVVLRKFLQQFVITERKKVVIFSGFEQALNLCEDVLSMIVADGQNVKHVRLDGRTPSAMRNLSMYLFQNDARYMVFFVSIRAGGEGLNLISSSTVLFLDEDWNPQVMKQAESRVHRIGQTQPVQIFRIQAKGTVEEQMTRRLVKKAYLAETITGNTDVEPYTPVKAIGFGDGFQHQHRSTALRDTLSGLFGDMISSTVKPSFLKDLNTYGWKDLVELCAVTENEHPQSSIPQTSITIDEERAWMERSARVRTNIFNGEAVDTSGRSFSVYKETIPLDLCRADRRIGKERTVMIDGFAVAKDSIIDSAPLSPGGKSPSTEKEEERSSAAKMSHELVSRIISSC
ncbi:putative nucleosome remodeling complex ATPase subunit (Snf2h) [Aspergillus melleus]|uniref:putative nucleosome remodeling complex ATPase subunit (Snf2h) n=1 Tax=Aspergillus melleus TaxID=138277 RepID=UPI001E8D7C30|nr:uncharacterized protein LDX57_003211 [Aspergillus melleus]KAH8425458.1 hypothetical protein LDX57_003211 [Aspergillus melleus]